MTRRLKGEPSHDEIIATPTRLSPSPLRGGGGVGVAPTFSHLAVIVRLQNSLVWYAP